MAPGPNFLLDTTAKVSYTTNTTERETMQYRATITIDVDGADAPDSEFLYNLTNGIEEYLSFEGEQVTVTVDIQPQSYSDGVAV